MAGERWIFTKSQLEDTPSRKNGIDSDKELTYRQQAANLIQEMGQRLQVTQLCINTAIVYMHRFYMFHPFTKFHRNAMASACLFLAAKVEEQPRKLEHVLKVTHLCLHKEGPSLDTKSNEYLEQAHELVVNENILLQTLGFDLTVDHPHTHVVKTCQLVRATKDLAQTSYFLATNSLHLTTMCLQLKPTLVACVCVHLACRWSSWEIPRSSEGREWYWYMDKTVTEEKLEELTQDFLNILDKCPSKLRKKIMMWKSGKDHKEENYAPSEKKPKFDSPSSSSSKTHTSSSHHHHHHQSSSSHEQKSDRKHSSSQVKQETPASSKLTAEPSSNSTGSHSQTTVTVTSSKSNVSHAAGAANKNVNSNNSPVVSNAVSTAPPSATTTTTTKTTLKEYTERKERERLERLAMEKAAHDRREWERNVQYGKVETELVDAAAKRPVKTELADVEETKKHVKVEQAHHNASETTVKTEPVDYDRKNKTEHSQHSSSEAKLKKSHHGHHHHHKHSGSEMVPGSEIKLKIKTDSSSSVHSVKKEGSSPLKLKIKMPIDQSPHQEKKHKTASPASQSSEQKVPPLKITHSSKMHADGSSSKHERSESHRSKSHKSSRHSHAEQSAGNSSSDGSHSGTNGRSDLKLHINMSALSSKPSSSEKKDKRSHSQRDAEGSKRSSSQSAIQSSGQHSGHPWTVSEFMSQKKPSAASSSKKRQHSPAAADLVNDAAHRNKVSRSDSTMRRSSSNHSLVSMDMSDTGSLSGSGSDHFIETENHLRGLNPSVNSMTNSPIVTDNTKQTLDHSIQVIQQVIERQKAQMAATPTGQVPAPQYPQMVPVHNPAPIQSLFDIDFLSDDTLPPLPGDPPQRPPTPPL